MAAVELAPSPPPGGEEGEADHAGGFVRLTLGLGVGHVEGGRLGPEPGFHPIEDLSHTGPVLGAAFLVGGGAADLALAGELTYERMLTHLERRSEVGFSLYGIGIAGTAYSDDEWFVTAHLRWLMMMLWRCEIPCWWDRGDTTMGPGVGVTVGKEWFDKNEDDEDAVGIALQGNYASLNGEPQVDYYSGLLLLTLTSF